MRQSSVRAKERVSSSLGKKYGRYIWPGRARCYKRRCAILQCEVFRAAVLRLRVQRAEYPEIFFSLSALKAQPRRARLSRKAQRTSVAYRFMDSRYINHSRSGSHPRGNRQDCPWGGVAGGYASDIPLAWGEGGGGGGMQVILLEPF